MHAVRNIFFVVMAVFMTLALSGSTVAAQDDDHNDLPGHGVYAEAAPATPTYSVGFYAVSEEQSVTLYQGMVDLATEQDYSYINIPAGAVFEVTRNITHPRADHEYNTWAMATWLGRSGYILESTFDEVVEVDQPRWRTRQYKPAS